MGELIGSSDIAPLLTPKVGGGSNFPTIAPQQSDVANLVQDLKGLKELADTVDSILGKIVSMRGKGQQKETSEFSGGTPTPQAPAQIQSNTAPAVRIEEKVIYVAKPINPDKIKQLLAELIYNEAPAKLPDEIKEKKVEDMIGDKFKNEFKFMYKGIIPVNGDQVLQTIAEELAKMIKKIQDEEE